MYITPLAPCARCARAIVQAQISRVVVHADEHRKDWGDEMRVATQLLEEAGVEVCTL
jgi:deoxycytidylate deaminase